MAFANRNRKHNTNETNEANLPATTVDDNENLVNPNLVEAPQSEEAPETTIDREIGEQTIAEALQEIADANPITKVEVVGRVYTESQLPYVGKTSGELFAMFGGESSRGAISTAIRTLTAVGFSRGETAKMLNKRYQHVRNVLIEAARSQEANDRKRAIAAKSVTLPVVE